MRLFEILILVILFMRFVGYAFPTIKRSHWIDWTAILAMLLILIHLVVEKFRLQMIPAYALAIILFLLSLRRLRNAARRTVNQLPAWFQLGFGLPLRLMLFMVVAGLPILIPVFHPPAPTGPYQVGSTTLHLVDDSKPEIFTLDPDDRREIMVRIWYPAQFTDHETITPFMENPPLQFSHLALVRTHAYQDAEFSNNQPEYPVLIFSHGHVGFMEQNLTLFEELASHGYIVCSIAHPYQAIFTAFPDGRIVNVEEALANDFLQGRSAPPEVNSEHLQVWTQDTLFLINELEKIQVGETENLLTGRLDLESLGIFGQSFGGMTAVKVCTLDDRCRAGISLDSGLAYDYSFNQSQPLTQPFLFMLNQAAWYSRDQILDRLTGPVYVVGVQDTLHLDFTDLYLFSPLVKYSSWLGPIDGSRMTRIINAYVLAFWDETLKGENSPLLDGPSPDYPEIKTDFVKP